MPILTLENSEGLPSPDVVLFRDGFYANLRAGTLYATWKKSNPGESSKFETYATAVINGQSATAPSLATATGKAFVAAAKMAANQLGLNDYADADYKDGEYD